MGAFDSDQQRSSEQREVGLWNTPTTAANSIGKGDAGREHPRYEWNFAEWGRDKLEDRALSRALAHHELADKFEIVKEGGSERLPNQVTHAEYERICNLYGDIRAGIGDLRISTRFSPDPEASLTNYSPDPEEYQQGVLDEIARMLQTRMGRELIARLNYNVGKDPKGNLRHEKTWIMPDRLDMNQNGNPFDDPLTSLLDDEEAGTIALGRENDNTGALVFFNPGMHFPFGDDTIRSDVVLAHELCHAAQLLFGEASNLPVTSDTPGAVETDVQRGVALKEYGAVGLGKYAHDPFTENRYRAERRLISKSFTGFVPGDDTMALRTRYTL